MLRKTLSYLLLFAGLVTLACFQNCGSAGQVQFSLNDPSQTKGLQSDNNGGGYLGKLEGTFARTNSTVPCSSSEQTKSTVQGILNILNGRAEITQDTCIDTNFPVADSLLDFAPYNPNFIAFNIGIYEKVTGPIDHVNEALCRNMSATEGFDVVVQNRNSNYTVQIYTGQVQSGSWNSRQVPAFSVARDESPLALSFQSSGFSLSIDLQDGTLSSRTGNLRAVIDGVSVQQKLNCRLASTRSVFTNPVSGTSPMLGLLGLWAMESNFLDVSGNNLTALANDPQGTLQWGVGQFGQSLKMDGTHSLRVTTSSSLNNLPALSLTSWVKVLGGPNGQSMGGGILRKSDPAMENLAGWNFRIPSGTTRLSFRVGYQDQVMEILTNTGCVAPDQWNHLVATWDGSTNPTGVKLYSNGLECPSEMVNFGGPALTTRTDDSAFSLQIGDWADRDNRMVGELDQVGIWNRILSAQEVNNLFSNGVP